MKNWRNILSYIIEEEREPQIGDRVRFTDDVDAMNFMCIPVRECGKEGVITDELLGGYYVTMVENSSYRWTVTKSRWKSMIRVVND